MPLYMDIHRVRRGAADDVAKAHIADMDVQDRYDVEYLKYWFNERLAASCFCLVEAPSDEAANASIRKRIGLVAEKLIEVDPELGRQLHGRQPGNARRAPR